MILPIVLYGDSVLRKKTVEIDRDYKGLDTLIEDMFQTQDAAGGVGLAAPQIGRSIKLFVVDASPFAEEGKRDYKMLKNFKKVFINPEIVREEGEPWTYSEGCLSIPKLNEDVMRKERVTIAYCDKDFNRKIETYDGLIARIIQHEYDHVEGILFIDRISPLRRNLIKSKLSKIKNNKVKPEYKTK